MDLLLKNVSWPKSNGRAPGDIRISKGTIREIGTDLVSHKKEAVLDLAGSFVHAGLINAHDHLEMNLYPKLGTPPYLNYTEWAKDIYHPERSPLKEIEKTNIEYRLLWGGLKNLVSGVTTVIHHNPWKRILGSKSFPAFVPKHIAWAHSVALEKKLKSAFTTKHPFVIHAAEGVDDFARDEIRQLEALGMLRNNTTIVHGVAVGEKEASLLKERGVSLIWCPSSNWYMFNKTADIGLLKKNIRVMLGSDSTLTGPATLLDEMRVALLTGPASKEEIVSMVSDVPANVFGLPKPAIEVGAGASLFVTDKPDLFDVYPKDIRLVVVGGVVMLCEPAMDSELRLKMNSFFVEGVEKRTGVNVPQLKKHFEKKVGLEILGQNSVWQLLCE